MQKRVYPNFTVLRLLLAVEVVWFHVYACLSQGVYPVLPIPPVEAFFAISGVCIYGSLSRSGRLDFWVKRARRILPAFFLALALTGILFGVPAMLGDVLYWASLGRSGTGTNYPLWSLGIEEVTYLTLFVAFWTRSVTVPRLWAVLALSLACACLTKAYAGLFVGMAAGLIEHHTGFFSSLRFRWVALAFASVFALRLGFGEPPAFYGLACLAGAAFVLKVGSLPAPSWSLPLDASYGVYILHAPILVWLNRTYAPGQWLWLLVPASVLVGAASYLLVERPFLRKRDHNPAAVVDVQPVVGRVEHQRALAGIGGGSA